MLSFAYCGSHAIRSIWRYLTMHSKLCRLGSVTAWSFSVIMISYFKTKAAAVWWVDTPSGQHSCDIICIRFDCEWSAVRNSDCTCWGIKQVEGCDEQSKEDVYNGHSIRLSKQSPNATLWIWSFLASWLLETNYWYNMDQKKYIHFTLLGCNSPKKKEYSTSAPYPIFSVTSHSITNLVSVCNRTSIPSS